jgi:hypothetical protein
MSGAPIWSGTHEVPESSDGEGHHAEEDHDGAVHRPELVVELGSIVPPGMRDSPRSPPISGSAAPG